MKDANFANSNRYKSNKQSYMHLKKKHKKNPPKKPNQTKKKTPNTTTPKPKNFKEV